MREGGISEGDWQCNGLFLRYDVVRVYAGYVDGNRYLGVYRSFSLPSNIWLLNDDLEYIKHN